MERAAAYSRAALVSFFGESVGSPLTAAGYLGGRVAQMFLDMALIDLGATGAARTQGVAGKQR